MSDVLLVGPRVRDSSKLPDDLAQLKTGGSYSIDRVRRWMFHEGWPEGLADALTLETIPQREGAMAVVPRILAIAIESGEGLEGERGIVAWAQAGLASRSIPGHVRVRLDMDGVPSLSVAFYALADSSQEPGLVGQISRYGAMMPIPRELVGGETASALTM